MQSLIVITLIVLSWPGPVQRWAPLIASTAARHGLEPALVAAVVWHESAGDPAAVSHAGAVGLMQVMPCEVTGFEWRAERGWCAGALARPELNLQAGALILADTLRQESGDLARALARYNCDWGGTPCPAGWLYAADVLDSCRRLGGCQPPAIGKPSVARAE